MSHYLKITINCTNREALVRALQRVKTQTGKQWQATQIKVSDTPMNLYGYQNDKRDQVANIVIPRKIVQNMANDIGFELQKDGTYRAHISEFDSGFYNKEWQNQLMTYYGVEVAKMEAEKAGHTCTEVIDKKGRIELHVDYTVVEKVKTGGIKIMKW